MPDITFANVFFTILIVSFIAGLQAWRFTHLMDPYPYLLTTWASATLIIIFLSFINLRKIFYDKNIIKITMMFISYAYFYSKRFQKIKLLEYMLAEPVLIILFSLWEKLYHKKKFTKMRIFSVFVIILAVNFLIIFSNNTSIIDLSVILDCIFEHFTLFCFILFYYLKIKTVQQDPWIFLYTFNFLLCLFCSFFVVFEYFQGKFVNFEFWTQKSINFCIESIGIYIFEFIAFFSFDPILFAINRMTVNLLFYFFLNIFSIYTLNWSEICPLSVFFFGLFFFYFDFCTALN